MLMPTVGATGAVSFNVGVTRTFLYGFRNSFGTITTDSSTTAYPLGGTAPFTFEVEYVSGDSTIYPVRPGATTEFAVYSDLLPTSYSGVFRFKVTDNLGAIGYSEDISVLLESKYGGGGFIP